MLRPRAASRGGGAAPCVGRGVDVEARQGPLRDFTNRVRRLYKQGPQRCVQRLSSPHRGRQVKALRSGIEREGRELHFQRYRNLRSPRRAPPGADPPGASELQRCGVPEVWFMQASLLVANRLLTQQSALSRSRHAFLSVDSAFRVLRHPLWHVANPLSERLRANVDEEEEEAARAEILAAVRDGDATLAEAHAAARCGNFNEARARAAEARRCFRYADAVEREANALCGYDPERALMQRTAPTLPCPVRARPCIYSWFLKYHTPGYSRMRHCLVFLDSAPPEDPMAPRSKGPIGSEGLERWATPRERPRSKEAAVAEVEARTELLYKQSGRRVRCPACCPCFERPVPRPCGALSGLGWSGVAPARRCTRGSHWHDRLSRGQVRRGGGGS